MCCPPLQAVQLNWKRHSDNDRKVIKEFLIQLLVKEEVSDILDRLKSVNLLSELFTKAEMQFLAKKEVVIADVPPVLLGAEQNFFDSGRKSEVFLHFSCFSFTVCFVKENQEWN